MKTRKVGKIVSLILAIVLVATIMIPAVNVLADSTAQKYPGAEWIEASSFAELRTVLNSAKTDGTKTYIKLTGKIDMPTGARYVSNNNKGLFLGEVLKMDKIRPVVWTQGKDKWTATLGDAKSAEEAVNIINESKMAPASIVNPFDPDGKGANASDSHFYLIVTRDNLNVLENIFAFYETKYTNTSSGKPDESKDPTQRAKDYPSYYDTNLIIPAGTDVVIDLNGQTIDGGQSDKAYAGTPDYIQSIFVVNGKLTIEDFVGGGKLTGATGYLPEGTYDVTKFKDGIEQVFNNVLDGDRKLRHRFVNANLTLLKATSYDSEKPSDIKNAKYNENTAAAWKISTISNDGEGYAYPRYAYYIAGGTVTEVRGGAVYVSEGGEFTLNNGSITKNCTWMDARPDGGETSASKMIKADVDAVTKGGGVYVEAGGKFNMYGGEISNNASRAYQTSGKGAARDAYAYGGGVYLEGAQGDTAGAVMYMSGGKIIENATYSQCGSTGSSQKSARAYGGGVYVGEGAVCSIIGNDVEKEKTDLDMVKTFPQVSSNSCGAVAQYSTAQNPDVTIQGGGIYNGGTLNLKNALITANDFAEGDIDIPGNRKSNLMIKTATRVVRDPETGLACYINGYKADGTPNLVTRLSKDFNENLELATEKVDHATSGVYGTMIGNEEMGLFSDGAGVCVRENAKLVVGERVWITDNYDLVTTGHKAFASVRDYERTWQQTKNITDDRVVKTDPDTGKGANYTDPAGGYVYNSKKSDTLTETFESVDFTRHAMDGYAFSDTTDDVYLPEGQTIYKGGSLYETKIGVNYWNMVNADGTVVDGGFGQAGNRVIVKAGKDLTSVDPDGKLIWDEKTATPTQRDIQFFYLNDNNKNWERFKNVKRNATSDYYDFDKEGTTDKPGAPVYGYKLPTYIIIDKNSATPKHLCDTKAAASSNWDDRVRVTAIDTDNSAVNKDASPYEGYINYNTIYSANRWSYGTQSDSNATNMKHSYGKATYRISYPYWSPDNPNDPDNKGNKDFYRPKNGDFSNAIVNFPQRAYPVTAQMKNDLPSSYLKAKYMDYKVVYDNSEFGASEPVLRFGTYKDTESVDTIRKMFVTINFDEANTHYYGVSNKTITYNNTDNVSANTDALTTVNTPFADVDASARFYGSDRVNGTIKIDKVVPDYLAYGKLALLKAFIEMDKDARRDTLTSISKDKDGELSDLYFKGWKYYTSYGDGPEVVTLSNDDAAEAFTANDNLTLYRRGYFDVDLKNVFNPNINSQPCPSLTAIWYTKEELAAARLKVSNVKYQIIKSAKGEDLLRVVAIAGSDYPDFEAVGFVISTSNATPTIEGGYDYVVNSDIYERLGVTEDGTQKCYDVDQILGGNYYALNKQPSIGIKNFNWTFGDGSVGADSAFAQPGNITTGETGKKGYKDAGLFYTNIAISDENRNTVYFVTPYASVKNNDGTYTYYYGESRAICYADYVAS